MAKYMTILDALDAFDLYRAFNEIVEGYEIDFYKRSEIETDLRELIEEHEETYEFTPDEDGDYTESLERNLKEALGMIFEDYGMERFLDDDFSDDALDDDELAEIYNDGLEDEPMSENDESSFEEDDGLY